MTDLHAAAPRPRVTLSLVSHTNVGKPAVGRPLNFFDQVCTDTRQSKASPHSQGTSTGKPVVHEVKLVLPVDGHPTSYHQTDQKQPQHRRAVTSAPQAHQRQDGRPTPEKLKDPQSQPGVAALERCIDL